MFLLMYYARKEKGRTSIQYAFIQYPEYTEFFDGAENLLKFVLPYCSMGDEMDHGENGIYGARRVEQKWYDILLRRSSL